MKARLKGAQPWPRCSGLFFIRSQVSRLEQKPTWKADPEESNDNSESDGQAPKVLWHLAAPRCPPHPFVALAEREVRTSHTSSLVYFFVGQAGPSRRQGLFDIGGGRHIGVFANHLTTSDSLEHGRDANRYFLGWRISLPPSRFHVLSFELAQ